LVQRIPQRQLMQAGHEGDQVEATLGNVLEPRVLHRGVADRLQSLGCAPHRDRIGIDADDVA
jgi:hypothetical protein